MATIRTLSQLLAELPDNTTRLINPADSRDIAATAFGFVGGTDPTPNNDRDDTAGIGAFFDQGSRWYNSGLNRLWICLTGVPTAAVWAQITGPAGPAGSSNPIPWMPEDAEDAVAMPGIQGQEGIPGAAGGAGPQGLTIPGLDGEDGQEGQPVPGPQGIQGSTGDGGSPGASYPGLDGEDGEPGQVIPGYTGADGIPGLPVPGLAGEEGEDGLTVPGQKGDTGTAGAAGGTGATGQAGANGLTVPGLDGEEAYSPVCAVAGLPAWVSNPDTCRCTNANNQTTTTGTPLSLAFDTDTWDSNGLHPTGAGNTLITAVNPGKYQVDAFLSFAANGVGVRAIAIQKNGAGGVSSTSLVATSGAIPVTICVSDIVSLATGDTIGIQATQSSGGNLNVTSCAVSVCQIAP